MGETVLHERQLVLDSIPQMAESKPELTQSAGPTGSQGSEWMDGRERQASSSLTLTL